MNRVIYRKLADCQIIALFPDQKVNRHYIMSYMHNGQHSEADYNGMMAVSVKATKEEYTPLHNELVNLVGYDDLEIRQRANKTR